MYSDLAKSERNKRAALLEEDAGRLERLLELGRQKEREMQNQNSDNGVHPFDEAGGVESEGGKSKKPSGANPNWNPHQPGQTLDAP